MNNGYEQKPTQKARLLEALKEGKRVTQINLIKYIRLLEGEKPYEDGVVDAIADLGIANLPARIFGLKKDGYKIGVKKVNVNGRFCKTFYYEYFLEA